MSDPRTIGLQTGGEHKSPSQHSPTVIRTSPAATLGPYPPPVPRAGPPGAQWDAPKFFDDFAQAKLAQNTKGIKALFASVAEHNSLGQDLWPVPRTIPVSHAECMHNWSRMHIKGNDVRLSFSEMTTAEALLHFARERRQPVCALNFANGETPGGGYLAGATAQEEDLCRQMPTLYTSLNNAKEEGLYPFGPCTCSDVSKPAKYSDVRLTHGITIVRDGPENGYCFLEDGSQATVSLVSAAAPNIRFRKEVNDRDLMYQTIQTIFIAPRVVLDDATILVLGAWGCGAFGGDPTQIAELFAEALVRENLGQLYQEVHFAIPRLSTRDDHAEIFRTVFEKHGLNIENLSLPCPRIYKPTLAHPRRPSYEMCGVDLRAKLKQLEQQGGALKQSVKEMKGRVKRKTGRHEAAAATVEVF